MTGIKAPEHMLCKKCQKLVQKLNLMRWIYNINYISSNLFETKSVILTLHSADCVILDMSEFILISN